MPRPKLALWHGYPARERVPSPPSDRIARPVTDQVRGALSRLARTPALWRRGGRPDLAGELDVAMHRIGQLTTLISVLDGLRGLLDSAQD
ncbi:MAG: hypothetical protein V4864_12315 [Pseudomonadota bacterium]